MATRIKRFGGRSVFLASALLAGFAQAAGADGRAPVKSLLEMRRERVVVQEWDLSCGAAALATILHYQHGDFVPERDIAEALVSRKEYVADPDLVRVQQGFSLLDLKHYVEGRGYQGIGYGRLELHHLDDHAPIITPVSFHGYPHFVVYRGRWGNRVLLADPAWGNRTLTLQQFEDAWITYPEFGHVGFVVANRDGSLPPNALAPRPSDFPALH
jgi:predicted double-glycine peptidase